MAHQKILSSFILKSLYNKSRIIATHPPFFLLFRIGNRREDDYTRVEGHFEESNFLQQILTTCPELTILFRFQCKEFIGPNRSDLTVGGSYITIFKESGPSISLSLDTQSVY